MFTQIRNNKGQSREELLVPQIRISREHSAVLWAIPKCASTAIRAALRPFGFKPVERDEMLESVYDTSLRHYAFTRNPYPRAVSSWWESRRVLYHPARRKHGTFIEFLHDAFLHPNEHWEQQLRFVPWKDDGSAPIPTLLKIEDGLDKQLAEIVGEPVPTQIRNKRDGGGRWQSYYSSRLALEVFTAYHIDFELGGYSQDSWKS